jgi:transcriptional regulator with XRE-family HTH domain
VGSTARLLRQGRPTSPRIVERKDKECAVRQVDMAKPTKPPPSLPAEETPNDIKRAKVTEAIRVSPPKPGPTKTRKSAPEPELELQEAPPKTGPSPNRRAARTTLDELSPTLVYLGSAVRRARKEKNLTQLQLAKACGFNGAAIFMVEAGRQNMTIKSLMTVASKLGLEVGDLFPRTTPRTAAKLTELREVIGDAKDRIQAQLRLLERVSNELDEEARNLK